MGEVTNPPEENHDQDDSLEESDNSVEDVEFDGDVDDVDDLTSEELEAIDSKLDALNLALDTIENKRESIHARLMELLESSREIRKELEEEQAMNTDTPQEST